MNNTGPLAQLLSYPDHAWRRPRTPRWVHLTTQLANWDPPKPDLEVANPQERKWELVSALQKCIRRGHADWAQRVMGAMCLREPKDRQYLWRRVVTTACEDVGYGDLELMRFVVACSTLWRPSSDEHSTRTALSFLTAEMCNTKRSRVLCQLSLLEDWTIHERLTPGAATPWEGFVLSVIGELSDKQQAHWQGVGPSWALKHNWRAENLLKFSEYPLPLSVVPMLQDVPTSQVLHDLPDFAYDMHTRIGNRVRARLCGESGLKEFFLQHPTRHRTKAIGWALFMLEGGLIPGGLIDPRLSALEERCLALNFGWDVLTWRAFKVVVAGLMKTGVVNATRRQALIETYGARP